MIPYGRKKSVHADKGKAAEEHVREWLDARSARQASFVYHRYPDARTAQNLKFPAQPSDFLVADGRRHITWHLEVKETAEVHRLSKKMLRQYGKLMLFHLGGIVPVVVVHRTSCNDWLYLTAMEMFVGPDEPTPKSFPFEGLESYPTHGALLDAFFS